MSEAEAPPLDAANALVSAMLEACSAAIGPQVGVELERGEIEVDVESEPPEGELAVQPVLVMRGEQLLGSVEIVSPLAEIVSLARRMNGTESPEEKEGLTEDDLNAIGELLTLAGGSLIEAVQAILGADVAIDTGEWWRSDEPGDNAFRAEGPYLVGAGPLTVPDGPSASLFFRLPSALLGGEPGEAEAERARPVLLLDLDDELTAALGDALEKQGETVEAAKPEDERIAETYARAGAVFLSVAREDHLQLCRQLRLDEGTWRTPVVLCAPEPTRELVIAALREGASQVLRVPAEPSEVLRVLALAQPES